MTLREGILLVQANNSDLGQILYDVAQVSGLTIHGSIRSLPVYGVYGPHPTRDVLTDLLAGSGYNFMMVGLTPQGAPRDLVLTPRVGSEPIAASAATAAPDVSQSADVDVPDDDAPGPGVMVHAPPLPPENTQERVDQRLQRLQHMHDLQEPENPPK